MSKVIDKVDLTLLKKLVGELENTLNTADGIKKSGSPSNSTNVNDYIVEMSKATGLATGVMQEAAMLIMDIGSFVGAGVGAPPKNDSMKDLLSLIKGGGSSGFGGNN